IVSGFLTSPLDQDRMESGDATEIATYSTWLTFSNPSNSRALSFVLIIQFYSHSKQFRAIDLNGRQSGDRFGRLIHWIGIAHLHVQAQGLHFLDQHVERFRNAGFEAVVAFD